MDAQIVLWRRSDGVTCLGRKNPAHWKDRRRWELQVRKGARVIKVERFGSGVRTVTAAWTLWREDFGLVPWPSKRYTSKS